MSATGFTKADERQLADRGISIAEASRQLDLFGAPPRYAELVRPCTIGDGIERIREAELPELKAAHAEAARAGRFLKFVPASGAATRMFEALLRFQRGRGRELSWKTVLGRAAEGDGEAAALASCLQELSRFAFYRALKRTLDSRGEDLDGLARVGAFQPILDGLLGPDGLDYARLPKGLLKFHGYPDEDRTPFEEHLVEASQTVKDGSGLCRLHFTVSPEHREGFERLFRAVAEDYARRFEARFYIDYSIQHPFTDTLAVDAEDQLLRDGDGRLRFRPGGHGSLIENLNALKGDLVFIKNIDNSQPDRLKTTTSEWKRILGGHLARLQQRIFHYLNRLREPNPSESLLDEVLGFARKRLNLEGETDPSPPTYQCVRAFLISRLGRPLRVCGVVPNRGEPGGGPFWVRGPDGSVGLQIVEGAQVDPDDAGQQRILSSSTHFNPVDLVCGVRDTNGEPFDLTRFVDENAVIITRKSEGGRELKALERPGLWNGAMAGWTTVFVEVPIETFSPVKTVLDLLREEHQ